MTPEKLEFARTFTDREVMSSAISQLRAMAIDEYYATTDESKRKELEKRQLLLEFEARAVLGDYITRTALRVALRPLSMVYVTH